MLGLKSKYADLDALFACFFLVPLGHMLAILEFDVCILTFYETLMLWIIKITL